MLICSSTTLGVTRAFRIDGCEGRRRRNPWAQNRHYDAAQLAPGSAGADRGIGTASVLMASPGQGDVTANF